MRFLASLLTLLLAALPALATAQPLRMPQQPRTGFLTIEPALVDFGELDQGEKTTIEWTLRNTGDRPVRILNIRTGCGCTTTRDGNPTVVAPGAEETLRVEFNSAGREGLQQRTVALQTDDPIRPVYQAAFRGHIHSPLFFEPTAILFNDIEQGAEHTKRFSLFTTLEGGLDITGWELTDERFGVEKVEEKPFEQNGHEGKEIVFEVTAPETLPQADFLARLRLQSNRDDIYLPQMLIRGRVVGDVEFSPNRAFAIVRGDDVTSKTIQLVSKSNTPFEIESVELDREVAIELAISDESSPTKKELLFTITGEEGKGTIQASAKVGLRREGKDQTVYLEIPVIVINRPAARAMINRPPSALSTVRDNGAVSTAAQ